MHQLFHIFCIPLIRWEPYQQMPQCDAILWVNLLRGSSLRPISNLAPEKMQLLTLDFPQAREIEIKPCSLVVWIQKRDVKLLRQDTESKRQKKHLF